MQIEYDKTKYRKQWITDGFYMIMPKDFNRDSDIKPGSLKDVGYYDNLFIQAVKEDNDD